jgi:hypothetical protein
MLRITQQVTITASTHVRILQRMRCSGHVADACNTLCAPCRFLQALGRHQATISFQVVSNKVAGRVLSEATLQVQGSSLTLGSKQPLPGGITATPDTFKKPR